MATCGDFLYPSEKEIQAKRQRLHANKRKFTIAAERAWITVWRLEGSKKIYKNKNTKQKRRSWMWASTSASGLDMCVITYRQFDTAQLDGGDTEVVVVCGCVFGVWGGLYCRGLN